MEFTRGDVGAGLGLSRSLAWNLVVTINTGYETDDTPAQTISTRVTAPVGALNLSPKMWSPYVFSDEGRFC